MSAETNWQLKPNGFQPRSGPVALIVLDGVGVGKEDEGDAVHLARTPVLDDIIARYPTTELCAHGTAVGLPSDDDMGNSEVGHNALGAGRVFDQGAKLVDGAIADQSLFKGEVWQALTAQCRDRNSRLHFIGLLSDGNVHSHIDQLAAMIRQAHGEGVKQLCVHILLDGRDVPAQSSLTYVDQLEALLRELSAGPDRDYRIASGGGRMLVTMDRYEADWAIVERGWQTHVKGEGRQFASARAAIEAFREEDPQVNDQFLPPFVVAENGKAVGPIEDGDAVIFFNFRGDRAIEISRAFEDETFDKFARGPRPDVRYAGMMQYDGDLGIPSAYLVSPPSISRTMGEYLARNEVAQFACAETQKYGHVTYFYNGNRSGKFVDAQEDYIEIPSDRVTFDQRPWMKAAEVTDAVIDGMAKRPYRFIRVNYANGDMVGHTGDLQASIVAMEAVDLCLGRLLRDLAKREGIALVTADHGNADQMFLYDKKGQIKRDEAGNRLACTSHSLNAVRFTIVDPLFKNDYALDPSVQNPGLANAAATAMTLMGYHAPKDYEPSLIKLGG